MSLTDISSSLVAVHDCNQIGNGAVALLFRKAEPGLGTIFAFIVEGLPLSHVWNAGVFRNEDCQVSASWQMANMATSALVLSARGQLSL
ncbi:hypothetical protein B5K06_28515 [Rhizobium grahamii]|uniref:Uncharacterized protein n=1 Tax=Rhizobium grahamii TaxID=1120045 RepID=A0A370KHU3_9HYPH|nr:hypothetical protein B5K06_28515 [Rhizobium grahamii]